jgi:hypothetical protein
MYFWLPNCPGKSLKFDTRPTLVGYCVWRSSSYISPHLHFHGRSHVVHIRNHPPHVPCSDQQLLLLSTRRAKARVRPTKVDAPIPDGVLQTNP